MILSAVMGIGLVSYGVAEPISHLATPPHGLAEAGSPEAAVRAPAVLLLRLGSAPRGQSSPCSAWPSRIPPTARGAARWSARCSSRYSAARVNGPIGKVIDVLAVFATLFGTTTSLGFGALQINNGLGSLFGVPVNNITQVLIIAATTAVFTMSAVTGVSKA